MDCNRCQRSLAVGAKFCTGCGEPVRREAAEVTVLAPSGPPVQVAGVPDHGVGTWVPPTPVPPANASLSDLPVAILFPLRSWLEDQGWLRGRLGLFGAFAVAPFALLRMTAGDGDINRAAWGFAVYFGLAWMLAMQALIRPEPQDRALLAKVMGFTAIAGVAIAVALEEWLGADESDLFTMVFKVGAPEELAKALPVYLFVFRSRVAWTTRTYLFTGVVSGLAFGVTEAVMYTSLYDGVGELLGESTTVVSIWRLVTGGMFHACLAGITSYFIGLAYWYRRAVWPLMLVGLALTSVLHGAYNTWSGGWFGTVLAAGVVFVFLGYIRSGDDIALTLSDSRIS